MAQKVPPTTWQPLHYSEVLEDTLRQRAESRIHGLRCLNNEVKRRLISEAVGARETLRVADLCCGRGGDFQKFLDVSAERGASLAYVGVDVTPEQVALARGRHPEKAGVRWMVGDCFSEQTARQILEELGGQAHVVNCQFALHYAFKDSRTLTGFLNAVKLLCAPGGSFVFTTTDKDTVIEYATQEQHGDALCTVTLDENLPDGPFGAGLHFRLDNRVNDHEWLVHEQTLHSELVRRGFKRAKYENLQRFAHKAKCRVAGLTQEEWAIARLYSVGRYSKLQAVP